MNEVDKDTGATPLMIAVLAGSLDVVKSIVNLKDIQLSIPDSAGSTVLHAAINSNSLELLEVSLPSKKEHCVYSDYWECIYFSLATHK